jgi:hypothetical protein
MTSQGTQKEYRWFEIGGPHFHPFSNWSQLSGKRCIVLKMPIELMQPGAFGIDDFRPGSQSPLAENCRQALHCFTMIVMNATLDDNVKGGIIPVFECLPVAGRETEERLVAGYRLWIFYDSGLWSPGFAFEKLIDDNMQPILKALRGDTKKFLKRQSNALQKNKSTSAGGRYNGMLHTKVNSRDAYLTMCSLCNPGSNYGNFDESRTQGLHDPNNPAAPQLVFSIENAMNNFQTATFLSIDRKSYQPNEKEQEFRFPYVDRTYCMTAEQLRPDRFLLYSTPDLRPPSSEVGKLENTTEGHLYRKLMEADPLMTHPEFKEDEERWQYRASLLGQQAWEVVPQNFQYTVAPQMDSGTVLSVESIAAENARAMASIREQLNKMVQSQKFTPKQILAKGSELRKKFEEGAVNNFRAIWHECVPSNMISMYEQAVIAWGTDHLRKHSNFSCPQPKLTSNLSMKAEWAIQNLLQAEFLYSCHVAHEMILMITISELDAYYPETDKLHFLGVGGPGLAKSFAFNVTNSRRIPGTTDVITSASKQSDSAALNLNGYNEKWHEISEEKLDVRPAGGGRAQPVSEETNNFKQKLTECIVNRNVTHINEDGERELIRLRIPATGTTQGNTNALLKMISLPSQDRFFIGHYEDYTRPDKSLQQCMDAAQAGKTKLKPLQAQAELQGRLMQYRFCLACMMIRVNLLPKVDISWATKIMNAVVEHITQQSGEKQARGRLSKRMACTVQVLTIVNAIRLVFDSDVSPIRDKAFELKHMLLLKPFLTAGTEEAVMTLGLFKWALQSSHFVNTLLRAILKVYFPLPKQQEMDTTTDYQGSFEEKKGSIEETLQGMEENGLVGREWIEKYACLMPGYLCVKDVFKSFSQPPVNKGKRGNPTGQIGSGPAQKLMKTSNGRAVTEEHEREIKASLEAFSMGGGEQKNEAPPQEHPFMGGGLSGVEPKDRQQKVDLIAQQILPHMNPRPESKEVKHGLYQLLGMNVHGTINEMVMLLPNNDSHLYISKRRIQSLANDTVRRAIVDVLQDENTVPQRLAFDFQRNSTTPYLFNCIDIGPVPGKKPTKWPNPNFVDHKQLRMIESICTGADGQPIQGVRDAFAQAAFSEIGQVDPARMFFHEHQRNVLWTADDMKKYGFDFPMDMDKRAIQKVDPQRLTKYPEEAAIPRDSHFEEYIAETRTKIEDEYNCDVKYSNLRNALGY